MTQFIILTSIEEAQFSGPTAAGASLNPRLVDAGPYAGKYVLPIEVLSDPAHKDKWAGLSGKPVVDGDPETMWPISE